MKRALFIDRDGTIIRETQDERIDTFEKLRFLPGVITVLAEIAKRTDYELVMVSNQDGLGRPDFPEERFWGPHNAMLELLGNEGIRFSEILIDRHYEEENAATRKPNTGLLTQYMDGKYDLARSYVIGDRSTDMLLAKNLGAKGIFIGGENPDADLCAASWNEIRDHLLSVHRTASVSRKTRETDIRIEIDLDGRGNSDISTGIGFFDHMLELFSKHAEIDCMIRTVGDLKVDEHHSIEDTALVLGEALRTALGDKRGIERYGFMLPMDEARAEVALDLSGRPFFEWDVKLHKDYIGDMPADMFWHFFKSLSDELRCTLHIRAKGKNDHHVMEGVFKAFARTLKQAKKVTSNELPSTKGIL